MSCMSVSMRTHNEKFLYGILLVRDNVSQHSLCSYFKRELLQSAKEKGKNDPLHCIIKDRCKQTRLFFHDTLSLYILHSNTVELI